MLLDLRAFVQQAYTFVFQVHFQNMRTIMISSWISVLSWEWILFVISEKYGRFIEPSFTATSFVQFSYKILLELKENQLHIFGTNEANANNISLLHLQMTWNKKSRSIL